jgi:hypothetical protein
VAPFAARTLKRSMRQTHRAGEKLFIDFAGPTVPLADGSRANIFVAAMGASGYCYALAEARLEAAWAMAVELDTSRYTHIRDILANRRDKLASPAATEWSSPAHSGLGKDPMSAFQHAARELGDGCLGHAFRCARTRIDAVGVAESREQIHQLINNGRRQTEAIEL